MGKNENTETSSEDSSAFSLSALKLTPYEPQDDFLKLIVCGDGKAFGFRFGIPIYGKWVFQMKNAIDISFMNLFQPNFLPKL